MEVYGQKTGNVIIVNNTDMRLRVHLDSTEHSLKVTVGEVATYEDPFSYLAHVIRNQK